MNRILLISIIALFFNPGYNYAKNIKKTGIVRNKAFPQANITNNIKNKKTQQYIKEKFKNFNSKYNNKWKVKYNKNSQMVRKLYGFHTKSPGKDFKNAGKSFLKENRDLFQIDTDTLQFIDKNEVSKFIHTGYQQYYKGIPVENGIVKMSYLKDGGLIFLNSDYVYNIDLPIEPNISEPKAISKALQHLNPVKYKQESIQSKIVIFQDEKNGGKYLCYKISLYSQNQLGAYVYFIDALNGNIINKYDILMNTSGHIQGNILPLYHNDGFVTKPIKNVYVKVDYGGGIDNVTTDTQGDYISLQTATTVSTYFEGENFYVINQDTANASCVSNSTGGTNDIFWAYNKDDTHMDELNVYYHLERIRDLFINTFNESKINSRMSVYVHNGYTNDSEDLNAFYMPFDNGFYFGDGGIDKWGYAYENFSHFADIIYHEYTHAVVEHIYYRDIINSGEHGAINEAYADYFSCSFLNDPIIGENCLPGILQRNLNGTLKRYPDDWVAEVHDDSLIFSQALWEIRSSAVGSNATDQLVYNSLYFGPVSFNSGMEAILIADDNDGDLSNGTPNETEIKTAFNNHGIPTGSDLYVNDTYEINNSFGEAYSIVPDWEYTSYISIQGDFDYYKVTLTPRDKAKDITVKLELPYSIKYNMHYLYNIYIYDSNKKQVAEDIDEYVYYFEDDTDNWYINKSSKQVSITPTDNTYYILIVGSFGLLQTTDSAYNTSTSEKPYILNCRTANTFLGEIKVFPNPYKPNDNNASTGSSVDDGEDPNNSGIIFQGLAKDTKLKIFDLKGRLIFEKNSIDSNWWQWDVKDSNGEKVTSGIYFYLVIDTAERTKSGKFAIIK